MTSRLIRIVGYQPLRGSSALPPDPHIARRAILLAALADGETELRSVLGGELLPMLQALHSLGVEIDVRGDRTRISGRGLRGLCMPPHGVIDCGRSAGSLALLAGVLAAQPFGTRLQLSDPPEQPAFDHLVGALRARGAHIAGTMRAAGNLGPPLSIAPLLPDEPLRPIECELPESNPDAKSAILLSGLFATGSTTVCEPLLSPDHTERMLSAMGVPLRRMGSMSGFDPATWNGRLTPLPQLELPGDPTLAASLASVASSVPGSRIALQNVGWNPTRTGFFDALHLLGGQLLVIAKGDRAGNEPVAELQTRAGRTRGGTMGGEVVQRCGDALPALCALGAHCNRGLELVDGEGYALPGDLFWQQLAELLRRFGAGAQAHAAGLSIAASPELAGTEIDARADARLAWAAVLCGLTAHGETRVHNADAWIQDQPAAVACLRSLGAHIEVAP